MYHNERESGNAIKDFLESPANTRGLGREDVHFTSKLAANTTYDRARKSISRSVKDCGLGYINLFLLHSPYGGKKVRLEAWRAVEDAIDAGEVKIGGVSNYGVKHVSYLIPASCFSVPNSFRLTAERASRLQAPSSSCCEPDRSTSL